MPLFKSCRNYTTFATFCTLVPVITRCSVQARSRIFCTIFANESLHSSFLNRWPIMRMETLIALCNDLPYKISLLGINQAIIINTKMSIQIQWPEQEASSTTRKKRHFPSANCLPVSWRRQIRVTNSSCVGCEVFGVHMYSADRHGSTELMTRNWCRRSRVINLKPFPPCCAAEDFTFTKKAPTKTKVGSTQRLWVKTNGWFDS